MKIGALIPVWNQEQFIGPHLKMLSNLDKIVVIFNQEPLGQYHREHNYGLTKDRTEEIVKSFPNVEFYKDSFSGEFGSELFNRSLKYVKDCDIVFKLDPDIFFTKKDWDTWVDFIRANPDVDCYRVNLHDCAVDYYVSGSFDWGVRHWGEGPKEIYAFNPKKELKQVIDYDAEKQVVIDKSWDGFTMHHLTGWKKTYPEEWAKNWHEFKTLGRVTAPQEIIDMFK